MNSKHKHSELMMQYAKDASTHEFPYMLWQYKASSGVWHDLMKHPEWNLTSEYRRKPIEQSELVKLSFAFMKPLKKNDIDLSNNQIVYTIFYAGNGKFDFDERPMHELHNSFFTCIIFHTTKENAQKHVDILNHVYYGEKDDSQS